ncbi:DUF2206 domain-containing protein [Chloroflexota bacterium]
MVAISNPLRMVDWEIKSFLKVVLAVQVAMWVVVGLQALGVHIPFLTELIGFIYLTFVPGVVILRALRLHNLGSTKTFLYSVGLSVAVVMFGGLLVSAAGLAIGIAAPLSALTLIIAFSIIVLVLCALSYIRDRNFAKPTSIEVEEILSPSVLFLALLLSLSIMGALWLNHYQNNFLLLCVMALIAVVVALIGCRRFIGEVYYPLVIFMIALTLLIHFQLSFSNLAGTDIQGEYHVARLTAVNALWDPMAIWLASYSDMLSITILPATYSILLGMEVMTVFKVLYSFVFALVPLGLYEVYRSQTDERTGFLAAFFFMSFGAFMSTMSFLTRMQVAELFFMLLVILALSKDLAPDKRVALFIIFSFSLTVSHYGLSYYFIFYLLLAWLFPIFWKWATKQGGRGGVLTATLIMLCLVATLSWYTYLSGSAILRSSLNIGEYIWQNIGSILDPQARDIKLLQGLGLAQVGIFEHSLLREIGGWLYRITYIMIAVGMVRWIVKRREMKFTPEYIGLSLAAAITMLASLVIPNLSYTGMGTSRTFHIALILLAPFCILGGETIFNGINSLYLRIRKQVLVAPMRQSTAHLLIIFLILIPSLLVNTGFIFEVSGDPPASLSLGKERHAVSRNDMVRASFYNVTRTYQEISGARWLAKYGDDQKKIYGDQISLEQVPTDGLVDRDASIDRQRIRLFHLGGGELDDGAYVYLRSFNVAEHMVVLERPRRILAAAVWMLLHDTDTILPGLETNSLIYSNGGSQIYYVR